MSNDTPRRGFLLAAIYGIWGAITAALAIPAGIYLLWPPRSRRNADWVEATQLDRLQINDPEECVFRRNRADGWRISSEKATAWVVRTGPNQVIAFAPQCTHLGCAYHWDEARRYFICPCHTSTFSIDGQVMSGPAPRPLDRYEVRLDSGKVLMGPLRKSV